MLNSKLIRCIIIFFLTVHITHSQKKDKGVIFYKTDLINKFHSINELETLKKGELITIYKDRMKEIITVLPLISLTNRPDVSLNDIGIKENVDNKKALKKIKDATKNAIDVISDSFEELMPYADSERIKSAILYSENIIKKMRVGIR